MKIVTRSPTNRLPIVFGILVFLILKSTIERRDQIMYMPDGPIASSVSTSTCLEIGSVEQRYRPSLSEVDKCIIGEPVSEYMQLLLQFLVGAPLEGSCDARKGCKPEFMLPYDGEQRRFGNDWPPYGYTMVGTERLKQFRGAIQEIHRNGIPGAIMEFGVWRGGSMIMAAAVLKELGDSRDLYLFDVFGTIKEKAYGKGRNFLAVDEETVKEHFQFFNLYNPDRVHFVKGLFVNTVQQWYGRSDHIAVLRVDGNFYDSYQDVMYAVYDKVPVGGIVIFDDVISHTEVMNFWEDFKSDQGIQENLVQIDGHSAWFRKNTSSKIDQNKKKLPRPLQHSHTK